MNVSANDDGVDEIEENQSVKTKSATEDLKTKIRKYLEENRYWTLLKQFNNKLDLQSIGSSPDLHR